MRLSLLLLLQTVAVHLPESVEYLESVKVFYMTAALLAVIVTFKEYE